MELQKIQIQNPNEWNAILSNEVEGHLLQSWEWGQFKERYGWQAVYLSWKDSDDQDKAYALILKRTIAGRFSILYCPRGPVLDWSDSELCTQILAELSTYAEAEKSIFIKIDPALPQGYGLPDSPESESNQDGQRIIQQLKALGWRPSSEHIQFRNTMHLDLNLSEEDLLKVMKQKNRYNIRLASRKEVQVRKGGAEDLDTLYQMYAETAVRDGFTIREPAYYQDAWGTFCKIHMAQPFIAEVDGIPIAGIIVFQYRGVATYMYGMSRASHRDRMPNHLLQWEAIRWAKALGCKTYDLWGAPDHFETDDPMWGVYRFKEGFGAKIVRLVGAWDYPAKPILYQLYSVILPRVMKIMRIRG